MPSTVTLALAGDTMLGRGVAQAIERGSPLFSSDLKEQMGEADLFVLNLECCISERGEPWPDPSKPFFFRAPPKAAEVLADVGVSCVTLANNHALDFGSVALLDTLQYLEGAGIAVVGAGADVDQARRSSVLETGGYRLRVVGLTDHPSDYAARPDAPGVAFADLHRGVPPWLVATLEASTDPVLVTPHWGPNMTASPVAHVRAAATELSGAGATLVAGHSAHVFHGATGRVLYDLGDLVDDYAVDPVLRNDLGLVFLVELGPEGPERIEAVPITLEFCHTRLARGSEKRWVEERFVAACADMGTRAEPRDGRLVIV